MAQQLPPIPLAPSRPGISKSDTSLALSDRWVDGDKVRFIDGKPEKIGGSTVKTGESVVDPIRGALAWNTALLQPYVGIGTHRKLYVVDQSNDPTDITPTEDDGTLTDPFTVEAGSAIVTVIHADHGRIVGSEVRFENATAIGGITIDGTYLVASVLDDDTYTIVHSTEATSGATGGGSVDYEYELTVGAPDPLEGDGFGAGPYGLGDYGEPSDGGDNAIVFEPRVWNLDRYGDLLQANPVNGRIYHFNPAATPAYQRAEPLANSPVVCRYAFVTDERFIFALGVDNDPLNIKWADQDDPTNWTPGVASTANSRRVTEGTRLIAGKSIGNFLTGILTDTALYQFQYTGSSFVYESKPVGTNCGLVSPMAMVARLGVLHWMSQISFFMWGGGAVQEIPNVADVREFVRKALRLSGYEYKCNSHYNAKYNEIWWFYATEAQSEPGRYVAVSLTDYSWVCGTMERTSGTAFKGSDQRPILAGADGYLYQHEDGLDDNGSIMRAYIKGGRMQVQNGARLGEISGFIPDFGRQVGTLAVEVNTFERPSSIQRLDRERALFEPSEEIVDLRIGGRIADITITSETLGGDFRLGAPMLEVSSSGRRR